MNPGFSDSQPIDDRSDEEVLADLRGRLDVLRREAEARGLFVERYAPQDWSPPQSGRMTPGLYQQLSLANATASEMLDIPFLGRVSTVPLVGPLIDALKRPVHELVRIYIQYLVRQEFAHRQRLLRVLNEVVEHTDPDFAARLAGLEARLDALEQDLAEARASWRSPGP